NSKWVSIAAKMEEKGAKKYPTEFIQKEFKKIQADAALAAAAGVERGASALSADASVLLSAALKASMGWSEEDEEVEE
ncbi:MAG: hypothetical protein Q9228_006275, partial [Teloschistes exilis]